MDMADWYLRMDMADWYLRMDMADCLVSLASQLYSFDIPHIYHAELAAWIAVGKVAVYDAGDDGGLSDCC